MAEGIAGITTTRRSPQDASCRSLLAELCEEGKQMLKLTKIHRKNTLLMFPDEDAQAKVLEQFVDPPAHSNTYVMWAARYLVEKGEDE